MSRRTDFLAKIGLFIYLVGCGSYDTSVVVGTKPPARVASIVISIPSSLIAGQSVRGVAVPKDSAGTPLTDRSVAWSTSSASIASVTGAGMISAVSPGTAVLSASSEGVVGQAPLAVTAPTPTPIATVTVALTPSSVSVGQSAQASAVLKDSAGNQITGRTVTWQSSNTNVANVGQTGAVTAVAAGNAVISGSSDGKSGSSQLTVTASTPAPVASVSVSPATATVQVGGTVSLTATTRDGSGNILTGRVVAWSSADPSVASVNSTTGLVTGVAAGTVQVTATSETKTGSATITVQASTPPPPPPPPGSYNEPAGMTLIADRGFDAINEAGWHDTDAGSFSIVQDATAPISPSNVARMTYPTGFVAGSSPGLAWYPIGGYHTLYVRFAAKLSSNWYGQSSGFCKFFYVWEQTPNVEGFFFATQGAGTSPLIPYAMLQGLPSSTGNPAGTANFPPNLDPSARVVRGQWQIYEFILTGNSAGTSDGALDWYLDGVHVGHISNLMWTTSATQFTEFDFRPVWGGVGGSVPATQTMDWDNVYISGKN